MKRFFVWVLLTFAVLFALNAEDCKVLVYPYNEQIAQIVEAFFDNAVLLPKGKDSYDVDVILSEDKNYLQFMAAKEGFDVLLVPRVSDLQGFCHLELFAMDSSDLRIQRIYESISQNSMSFEVSCANSIAGVLWDSPACLVKITDAVPGSRYEVDGNEVYSYSDMILVRQGEHSLTVSCQGYRTSELSFDAVSGNLEMEISLVRNTSGTILVESSPFADLYIDSKYMGRTPFEISDMQLPLSLSLQANGYCTENITIDGARPDISVELKPLWMTDLSLQKNAKDRFYSALARSLLIFGGKLAAGAMNDGSSRFLSGVEIFADGALTLSIVDLVGCLIDYYRNTVYVTP